MKQGQVLVRSRRSVYDGQLGIIVRAFSRAIGVRRQKRWFHDVRFIDGQVRRFPDVSLVAVSAGKW